MNADLKTLKDFGLGFKSCSFSVNQRSLAFDSEPGERLNADKGG
jgi:hypothetical protein